MELKRPKRGETDEELLRMQEEFLKSKQKPSAAVYRPTSRPEETSASSAMKKRSKVKPSGACSKEIVHDEIPLPSVFGDIVERDVDSEAVQLPALSDVPFPKPEPCTVSNLPSGSSKSLFAMQMESRKGKGKGPLAAAAASKEPSRGIACAEMHAGMPSSVLGIDDHETIHQENLKKLAAMTEEERLEAQRQLLQQLDPGLVSFLRSRRNMVGKEASHSATEHRKEPGKSPTQVPLKVMEGTACLLNPEGSQVEPAPPEFDDTELPIPPSEAQQWVHMDVVEKDKLAWMTLLPKPRATGAKVLHVGRFDFEGNLVPPDADIPTQKGLHHHGEQPESAGYTVTELFTFLRSTVQSQRVLALQMLKNMLQKHWLGVYDGCLEEPLLPQLVEGGAVPLLRSALDDPSETALTAAVQTLRAFLVSSPDEVCLDRAFMWHMGHLSPWLWPGEIKAPLSELKDDELAKIDVIQGLLRMDVLPRLRYILEVCRPDATAVVSALEILIRIARHSLDSATKVFECPHLMNMVVTEFLPPRWGSAVVAQGRMTKVHGTPLWAALKLVRVIAAAGRHLATRLLQDHAIATPLCQYIAMDASDGKVPLQDYLHLAIESLRTWRVFLSYGLGAQILVDMFPIIMKQLRYCCTLSLVGTEVKRHSFDYEYGTCLLSCLRGIVHIAATLDQGSPGGEVVSWTQVQGLVGVVETCFFHWAREICVEEASWTGLALLGSAMTFLSDYYRRLSEQAASDPVVLLGQIEALCIRGLSPLLQSQGFRKLLENLKYCSSLSCPKELGNCRDSASLPSLGALLWTGGASPVVCEESPFHLLASLTHLVHTCALLHRGMEEVCQLLLCHPHINDYLHHVLELNKHNSLHWFSSLEVAFLKSLVSIAAIEAPKDTAILYHDISLLLLTLLTTGREDFVVSLLQDVIFYPDLVRVYDQGLPAALASLDLGGGPLWQSAAGEALNLAPAELLSLVQDSLPKIKATYVDEIQDTFSSQAAASRSRNEERTSFVESLSTRLPNQTLLPLDWIYLPVRRLCQEYKTDHPTNNPVWKTAAVQSVLCWTHLLFTHRSSVTDRIPPAVHYCRLASAFLTGNDLFLDFKVQRYLLAVLRLLLSLHPSFDLDYKDWPDLPSFVDFYTELVEHYAGVSYGDKLFSNFVLVPAQTRYDVYYRRFFFGENLEAVRITSLRANESLVPVQNFLDPLDKDDTVLSVYFRCIRSGEVNSERNPLLHRMAVHHIASYVHSEESSSLKCNILRQLSVHRDEEWARDVLDYKCQQEAS